MLRIFVSSEEVTTAPGYRGHPSWTGLEEVNMENPQRSGNGMPTVTKDQLRCGKR